MPKSLLQGKFSNTPIQNVCDCEQRRNTTVARTALGPYPDECILSGLDKILCFFGITDVYEWMGYCPMPYDCNILSSPSLSSLSEVDLDCTAYRTECLYINKFLKKSTSSEQFKTGTAFPKPPSSASENDFVSACSRVDVSAAAKPFCPPCKDSCCKRSPSPPKLSFTCKASQKSLSLPWSNFKTSCQKQLPRKESKIGKFCISTKPEQFSVILAPPQKQCSRTSVKKCPVSTSSRSSDRSSGSFSFRVTCRPATSCPQKKIPDFKKLPTINSSSLCKKRGNEMKSPMNKNCFDNKKKPQLKIDTRPKIVDTQWAIARINVFDDCSKTYEIMDCKKKMPKVNNVGKTQLFFAVLPDGTTCSYDCLGEIKSK